MSIIGVYPAYERGWIVRGDFDPDAARVIANALEAGGMRAEADEWREAASYVDAQAADD